MEAFADSGFGLFRLNNHKYTDQALTPKQSFYFDPKYLQVET
jgi:hypothetical protein